MASSKKATLMLGSEVVHADVKSCSQDVLPTRLRILQEQEN